LTILQTNPWDVTLIRWYIYLGLDTHEVGWPSTENLEGLFDDIAPRNGLTFDPAGHFPRS